MATRVQRGMTGGKEWGCHQELCQMVGKQIVAPTELLSLTRMRTLQILKTSFPLAFNLLPIVISHPLHTAGENRDRQLILIPSNHQPKASSISTKARLCLPFLAIFVTPSLKSSANPGGPDTTIASGASLPPSLRINASRTIRPRSKRSRTIVFTSKLDESAVRVVVRAATRPAFRLDQNSFISLGSLCRSKDKHAVMPTPPAMHSMLLHCAT
jgi:hypothetical protein